MEPPIKSLDTVAVSLEELPGVSSRSIAMDGRYGKCYVEKQDGGRDELMDYEAGCAIR